MIIFVVIGILLRLKSKKSVYQLLLQKNWVFMFLIAPFIWETLIIYFNGFYFNYSISLSLLIIIIMLYTIRTKPGIKLIIIGTMLNFLALVLHQDHMPVLRESLNYTILQNVTNVDIKHQIQDSIKFWWLCDWIPLYFKVFSPGDLIVGAGIIRYISKAESKEIK